MMTTHEPGAHLESFARGDTNRRRQAGELAELVSADTDWLTGEFPGAVERYSDKTTALKNISRRVEHLGLHRYIVKRVQHGPAYGISTVLRDKTIIHPTAGELIADDIDYWIGGDGRNDTQFHKNVVHKLILKAIELRSPSPLIMASARPDQPQAEAFANFMAEFEEPSAIAVEDNNDPYAMTKGGATVQLFTLAK